MRYRRRRKFSMKDKVTIWIKKAKPVQWYVCLALCAFLLVGLFICNKNVQSKTKVPAELTANEIQLRMTFAGDVEISDAVRTFANKNSYKSLLKNISGYWKKSDYVAANISGPVLEYDVDNYTSTREGGEDSFYVRPRAVRGFQQAGINMWGCANDATYNYGATGVRSTIRVLENYGMEYIGVRSSSAEPIYTMKEYEYIGEDGTSLTKKVAVFAVNDNIMKNSSAGENKAGVTNTSLSDLYVQIYEVSQVADQVIAYAHYTDNKEAYVTKEEEEVAHALIDAGADLVIGNSPTLKKAESYKEGLILYGIGSLITDDIHTNELDSVLVDFVVRNSGETIVYLTPIRIKEGRPTVVEKGIYKKRIQSIVTSGLEDESFQVMEHGVIKISLGYMPKQVETSTATKQN